MNWNSKPAWIYTINTNKTDETMTNNYHLKLIIKGLKKAIKNADAQRIKQLYDEAKMIDLDKVSHNIFSEYDDLVDQANDIVMEAAA